MSLKFSAMPSAGEVMIFWGHSSARYSPGRGVSCIGPITRPISLSCVQSLQDIPIITTIHLHILLCFFHLNFFQSGFPLVNIFCIRHRKICSKLYDHSLDELSTTANTLYSTLALHLNFMISVSL